MKALGPLYLYYRLGKTKLILLRAEKENSSNHKQNSQHPVKTKVKKKKKVRQYEMLFHIAEIEHINTHIQ